MNPEVKKIATFVEDLVGRYPSITREDALRMYLDQRPVRALVNDSSALRYMEYDPRVQKLYIGFHSGKIYQYEDVPRCEFDGLIEAPSKGRYFNRFIKPHYQVAPVC